jgi:hypothetical protein
MADVTAQHSEYSTKEPQWRLVGDAAAGEAAVKAGKESYLPRPNPGDKSADAGKRYEQYLARAVFYNATGRTLRTMVGMAFHRDPEVKLATDLDYAREDINGSGVTLNQQAQAALAGVLKSARAGLLTDFPRVANPQLTSKLDQVKGGIRPTIALYDAASITNWRTGKVGGQTVLTMVVLREKHEESDGFGMKSEIQYRVLQLVGGIYSQQIWRKKDGAQVQGESAWKVAEEFTPLNGAGRPLNYIPFQFIGAQNNDTTVDDAPLYDIATLNMAHYRNSADYEESVFFCGQPQFYMAGLTTEWVTMLKADGIYVGSRSILPLPVGGTMGLLQAAPNTLAQGAMENKEKQMAALGARLLIASLQVKTATQQDSEDSTSQSVLSLACGNVASAYKQALTWFGEFAASAGEVDFTISTDFGMRAIDAAELSTLLQLVQAGKLPEADLWSRLRAVGLIAADKDDEAIREEIESQTPPGTGDVDGGAGGTDPQGE